MKAPAWDSQFSESPVHGAGVQRRLFDIVNSRCFTHRVAVDAGAHIGTWTVQMVKRFKQVVAFEPVEENRFALLNNVRAPNLRVYSNALGAVRGQCGMTLPPGGNSGCWQVADGDTHEVLPLDAFGLCDVDLIKLDVEGAEAIVLAGAINTLTRDKPVVFFEDNGLGRRLYGDAWVDPRNVLTPLGYRRVERLRKNELWAYV